MKYIIEIPDNQSSVAEEFFKSVSFVKKVKAILPNEITNSAILQSIEDYENRGKIATILNLDDLKALAYA
jgi:hypothetical protein